MPAPVDSRYAACHPQLTAAQGARWSSGPSWPALSGNAGASCLQISWATRRIASIRTARLACRSVFRFEYQQMILPRIARPSGGEKVTRCPTQAWRAHRLALALLNKEAAFVANAASLSAITLLLLPNPYSILWSQIQRLTRLGRECFVPGVDVAYGFGAEFAWGVGVGDDLGAKCGIAGFAAP